ncbi:hypothetical protein J4410_01890 [Candidatus Woesearchaeota archaeon]|nr:hypothetical protein [Candidatus Woesearchaeota archaeon]
MIQKNINFLLLMLVVLATVVNVAAAVFYHATYAPLDADQEKTVKALTACEKEKSAAEFSKEEAVERLNIQQDREAAFADQFVENVEEAETLEEQVNRLKSQQQICSAKLTLAETQAAEAKGKVTEKTTTITDMFRQIKKLQDDLRDCEEEN